MPNVGVILTIEDGKGRTSTTQLRILEDGSDMSSYFGVAQSVAETIGDMIKGRIRRIGIFADVAIPGAITNFFNSGIADPLSDVEEGARFGFLTAGGYDTTMRIPTFAEELIVPGTKQVDFTDGRVAAFVDNMIEGFNEDFGNIIESNIPVVDTRDDDIVAVAYGREEFSKDRG